LNFWSPIGGIGAQFFTKFEFLVTNWRYWRPVFHEI